MEDFQSPEPLDEQPGNTVEQQDDRIKALPAKVSPWAAVAIGLGGGFLLYQILGGLLTILIFGVDMKNADMNAVRLLQIAGQVLFMLLPSLIFANYIYGNVTTVIRFRLPRWQEVILFSAGVLLLTLLVNGLMIIQQYWFDVWANNNATVQSLKNAIDKINLYVESTYKELMSVHSAFDAIIVVLTVAVTPAICEEVLFRGYTQSSFQRKYGKLLSAVITAFIFAVFHFNPLGIVGLFLLGLYFGFAAYKTDSILVPVILHFLNNFVAVVAFLGVGPKEIELSAKISQEDLMQGYSTTVITLVLFIVFIFFVRTYYKNFQREVKL